MFIASSDVTQVALWVVWLQVWMRGHSKILVFHPGWPWFCRTWQRTLQQAAQRFSACSFHVFCIFCPPIICLVTPFWVIGFGLLSQKTLRKSDIKRDYLQIRSNLCWFLVLDSHLGDQGSCPVSDYVIQFVKSSSTFLHSTNGAK